MPSIKEVMASGMSKQNLPIDACRNFLAIGVDRRGSFWARNLLSV